MLESEKLIQKTQKWLVLSLVIIGLISTASFFTLNLFAQTQKADASIINLAGRQRMLSQRTALGVSMLKNQLLNKQMVNEGIRDQIRDAANMFLASHKKLVTHEDSDIQHVFHEGEPSLNQDILEFVEAALNIAQSDTLADIQASDAFYFEAENVSYLLFRLNIIVNIFEELAEKKLNNSIATIAFLWFVLIVCLLC